MNIAVIDIGGTNVKVWRSATEKVKFPAGKDLTPEAMVARIQGITAGWDYDRLAIGYPGDVINNKPVKDPYNLGPGWVEFDFQKAFGRPMRMMNDAALQAFGSYDGGKMLYLGLGTSVGTTLIYFDEIVPLALGHLRLGEATYEHYLCRAGLKQYGIKRWTRWVEKAVASLKPAFLVDYVVLGGGNAKKIHVVPDGARLGGNHNVYHGGMKLWDGSTK